MKKSQNMLTLVIVIGVLAVLGIAAMDQFLFKKSLTPPPAEAEESTSSELPSDGLFRIAASQSEARFTLGEVLGGEATTVIGKTNQVTGAFSLDFENLQDTELGEILIDASTFVTDNSYRNRAIQNRILNTGTYQLISFLPTEIAPIPDSVEFGESLTLEISGDLTIKGVTENITFTANITPISATQIEGHAETMIAYADFDISIPSVPRVASVDEEVLLEIDFVALLDE
ncbi:MAG: YceI family protein [Chloroflexi bacterium]|nr:YceI family protein [Chloroflexota bacterium]